MLILLCFEKLLCFLYVFTVEEFQDVTYSMFAAFNWKQDLLCDLALSFMGHFCREGVWKQREKCLFEQLSLSQRQ